MSEGNTTIMVESWLKPMQNPDSEEGRQARNELIEHSHRRMKAMCHKMFFASLKSTGVVDWEDVYQEAAIKLWKALADAKPSNVREYFGLATKKIQEVSIDMCRKFVRDAPIIAPSGGSQSPVTVAMWSEFHNAVQQLPDKLRESFELLWYHDLTQKEAAEILGVDESTVKRRYRDAKEQLVDFVM